MKILCVATAQTTQILGIRLHLQGVTNVPSLQVQTESIQIAKGTVNKLSSLQAVSTPSPETKTEAVSTTGPTVSSPIQRSPDAGVSQAASFVATQTVGKLSIPSVTGTGSVTATPTVFKNISSYGTGLNILLLPNY